MLNQNLLLAILWTFSMVFRARTLCRHTNNNFTDIIATIIFTTQGFWMPFCCVSSQQEQSNHNRENNKNGKYKTHYDNVSVLKNNVKQTFRFLIRNFAITQNTFNFMQKCQVVISLQQLIYNISWKPVFGSIISYVFCS